MTTAQLATFSPEERAMVDAAIEADEQDPGPWTAFEDEVHGVPDLTAPRGYDSTNRIASGCFFAETVAHIVAAQPVNVLRTFEALADARIERDRLREENSRQDQALRDAEVVRRRLHAQLNTGGSK